MKSSELLLDKDVIYLRGEVSFTTAASLSRKLHQLMMSKVRELDCKSVTIVDSSIAALLLVVLRHAKVAGEKISITQLPQAVSRLIRLYDLEEIFDFVADHEL